MVNKKNKKLFVAMPFGDNRMGFLDHTNVEDLSRPIDFNGLWENVFKPAIPEEYDTTESRADESSRGGTIERIYLEAIAEADVMIADLTFANPNVYYELGMRHVMTRKGAVLVAQESTNLPFDLQNQKVIFYDAFSATNTVPFQKKLEAAIRQAEKEDDTSPVYLFLPRLYVKIYEGNESPEEQLARQARRIEELERQVQAPNLDATSPLWQMRIDQVADTATLQLLARQIAKDDGISLAVLQMLGFKLRHRQQYDTAIEVYNRMLEQSPDDPWVHREIGFSYRKKGIDCFPDAKRHFDISLKSNPTDPELHGMIGGMYKRQGELHAALESYEKAYEYSKEDMDELDPNSLYGIVTMGAISAALDGKGDAYKYYGEVVSMASAQIREQTSDHWTFFCLGEAHVYLKNRDEAISAYRESRKLSPLPDDLRSARESLEFLANHGVSSELCKEIVDTVLS